MDINKKHSKKIESVNDYQNGTSYSVVQEQCEHYTETDKEMLGSSTSDTGAINEQALQSFVADSGHYRMPSVRKSARFQEIRDFYENLILNNISLPARLRSNSESSYIPSRHTSQPQPVTFLSIRSISTDDQNCQFEPNNLPPQSQSVDTMSTGSISTDMAIISPKKHQTNISNNAMLESSKKKIEDDFFKNYESLCSLDDSLFKKFFHNNSPKTSTYGENSLDSLSLSSSTSSSSASTRSPIPPLTSTPIPPLNSASMPPFATALTSEPLTPSSSLMPLLRLSPIPPFSPSTPPPPPSTSPPPLDNEMTTITTTTPTTTTKPIENQLTITIPLPLEFPTIQEFDKNIVESRYFQRTSEGKYTLSLNAPELLRLLEFCAVPRTSLRRNESGVYSYTDETLDTTRNRIINNDDDDSKTLYAEDNESCNQSTISEELRSNHSDLCDESTLFETQSTVSTVTNSTVTPVQQLRPDCSRLPETIEQFLLLRNISNFSKLSKKKQTILRTLFDLIHFHIDYCDNVYLEYIKATTMSVDDQKRNVGSFKLKGDKRKYSHVRAILLDLHSLMGSLPEALYRPENFAPAIVQVFYDFYLSGKATKISSFIKQYKVEQEVSPVEPISTLSFFFFNKVSICCKSLFDSDNRLENAAKISEYINCLLNECNSHLTQNIKNTQLLSLMNSVEGLNFKFNNNSLVAEMCVMIKKKYEGFSSTRPGFKETANEKIVDRKGHIFLLKDSLILTKDRRRQKQKLIMIAPISRTFLNQIYFFNGSTIDPEFIADDYFIQENLSDKLLNITFKLGLTASRKVMFQVEILPTDQTSIVSCQGTEFAMKTLFSNAQKFVNVFKQNLLEYEKNSNFDDDDSISYLSRCNSTTSVISTDL